MTRVAQADKLSALATVPDSREPAERWPWVQEGGFLLTERRGVKCTANSRPHYILRVTGDGGSREGQVVKTPSASVRTK